MSEIQLEGLIRPLGYLSLALLKSKRYNTNIYKKHTLVKIQVIENKIDTLYCHLT